MTDVNYEVDADEAVAQKVADGLRRLRELRGLYDQATEELEGGRRVGKARIAELQEQIDAENATLVAAVNDAAVEFNDASSELVETGFATPKALAAMGLGTLRVKK
ncbi:hypothetical protein H7J07_06155 [Mycobacterium koreense]|uniref:Uncharacterized protein n=1 Tax=Mycolicibacillus koreensis TaxID=1069220 RepID=A0A7I7SBD8_9MYCO|nr:hypothetical protein [Mycolicibacillus koreensis]MCV7247810.1 hypothetical protein [Mycolicibacillus koreensis]OSC34674.1 hypothetical protein B8W67_05350 [Mycolicibacillus koreensis]BBY54197.1 hypothetical protein MKOR_14480 [Mycolicibacillus koreensis]